MNKKVVSFFQNHQFVTLLLFFLIVISIRFLPFYFGRTLFFGDNYSLMVPGKLFTAYWLQHGVLPLWNPYIFAGLPWIGDINQSVLYPTTLLFLMFPSAVALNMLIVSQYVWTVLGMFLLSRLFVKKVWQQYLATALWTLSTQIAGSTNNFSTLQSLVWLPWIVWSGWFVAEKHSARLLFGVLVLFQFLGGYPQHVLFSIAYAVVVSLVRHLPKFKLWNWLWSWALTAFYTLLISAVAWVPFVDLLLRSTRMEQSAAQAQVGSLNPVMLIKPFAPYFFDHAVVGMKWGPAWSGQPNVVFVITLFGLLVVAYSCLRLRQWDRWGWLFAGTTCFTIIFSLGEYLPGYELIQQAVPLFRIGRYPSMLLIIGSIAVIFWFVRTLDSFQLSKKYFRILLVLATIGAVGMAALYLAQALWLDALWNGLNQLTGDTLDQSRFHTIARDAVIIRVVSITILAAILSFIVSLWLWQRKSYWLLVVVLIAEMLFSTQGMFIFGNNGLYPNLNQVEAEIQTLPAEITNARTRVLTRNSNKPYTDYGTYWEALVVRKPFSDSFIEGEELKNNFVLQRLTHGFTPNWNMVYRVPTIHGYTTLLPLEFAKLWQTTPETRINFIDSIDPANALLAEWAVQYYLVDEWFFIKEDLEMYPRVTATEEVVVRQFPDTLDRFRLASGEPLEILQLSEDPNKIEILLSPSTTTQDLVIADRYDPDIRATADDKPLVVENFREMRKIALPAGAEKVTIWYQPRWFWRGFAITTVSLLVTGGYLVVKRQEFSSLFK